MTINRLIYVSAVVAAFVFYMLYPPWISWYLLVLLLLLIPLDLFLSLPGMLSKSVSMSVPEVLEKGKDGVIKLTTVCTKSYPVREIITIVSVTGDDLFIDCRFRCPVEEGAQREVTIDTSCSGLIVFTIKRISMVSLLGLFSRPVNTGERKSVLILPPPVKPANTVTLQRGIHLHPKPGGGFSEEHDMRPYRQGDPVRSIHWKVSAKHDSLVIREPLVPPPHSRLVHVMPWNTAEKRDEILGNLRWVTEYLLTWQMPFYVKFGDDATIAEITHESDLVDFLRCVLDDTEGGMHKSNHLSARFSWVFRIDGGSIIADTPPEDAFSDAGIDTGERGSG